MPSLTTTPDLSAPFTNPTIREVRTSKMKFMHNLSIETGIYKKPRTTRVFCTTTGLESDEHDLTFHGGIDKAVHQYFPGHYPTWIDEYPESSAFEPGAFGENLVVDGGMNERNVCIGDIYRVVSDNTSSESTIGEVKADEGLLLQISLPRQPCFKLNHRFNVKNFAAQTTRYSRTGWYYRVLREGWVGAGDTLELIERRWPRWTIERVQEYVHRDRNNLAMLEELARIDDFGNEIKQGLGKRIEALKKTQEKKAEKWREFELLEKKMLTGRVASLIFQNITQDGEGDELDPGNFVRLRLPNGLIRPYSVVSGNSNKFELGIALEDNSRGGSSFLHKTLQEGDKIHVGNFTASVPINGGASNHIFIAGGIGITAFFTHFDVYDQINFNYQLHYAVQTPKDIPYVDQLKKLGDKCTIYVKSNGERMDIHWILANRKWNSQIYTCGPQRMIDEVQRVSKERSIPQDEVHYEAFQLDTAGDPFTVELAKSKKVLEVDGEKTLLQTLREAGLEVDSSCETGNCGTCRIEVCSGKVDHRGSGLGEEDKKVAMLSCVSRGLGRIVIDF